MKRSRRLLQSDKKKRAKHVRQNDARKRSPKPAGPRPIVFSSSNGDVDVDDDDDETRQERKRERERERERVVAMKSRAGEEGKNLLFPLLPYFFNPIHSTSSSLFLHFKV